MGRFRSFEEEASLAVDHSLNFFKENLRRVNMESITIIKPERTKEEPRALVASKERNVGLN